MGKVKQPAKPKAKAKPKRILPAMAKIFFRGKDAFPAGKLTRDSKGGGYFGSFTGDKPKARDLVFHLEALPKHRKEMTKHKRYRWAEAGSVGHTTLSVFPEKKAAVLTTIQSTVDLKSTKLTNQERQRYRNWHLATALTAMVYCRNRGFRLYAVSPKNYRAVHHAGHLLLKAETEESFRGAAKELKKLGVPKTKVKLMEGMSRDIVNFYEETLKKIAQTLNLKLREVETAEAIGVENGRFFGGEILQIL